MDRDSPHEATVADRGPASTEGFGNLALWWHRWPSTMHLNGLTCAFMHL